MCRGFLCKGIFCELKPQSQEGMGLRVSIHLSSTLSAYREAACRTLCSVLTGWLLPEWIIGTSRMQQLPRPSTHRTVPTKDHTWCAGAGGLFQMADICVGFLPVKLPPCFAVTSPGSWMGSASNPSSATLSPVWFMFLSTPEHHGAIVRYVRLFMKTHRQ